MIKNDIVVKATFFSIKFLGKVFVIIFFTGRFFIGTVFVSSIISPHITIELTIILPKFLTFLQVHVLGFQI